MARAYFSLFLIALMMVFYYSAVNAQEQPKPIEVTAKTEPTFIIAGEIQYTLKFWNVGAGHPNAEYGKATLETDCLRAEGGWECSDIDEVKEGIFTGGPNGTFSFDDASFKLVDGKTAVVPTQDFTVTFVVENPEAFNYWQKDVEGMEELLPRLEKSMGEVSFNGEESGGVSEWLAGKRMNTEFPVSSELETKDGQLAISYPDGSRAIVLENSKIRFTNGGIYMEKGSCYLDISVQEDDFLLQDSRGNYTILGTSLYWDTDQDKTMIDLMEGVVQVNRLTSDDDQKTLVSGESLVVTNEDFTEIQNFNIDQRLEAMKAVDEGIVDENSQSFPIGYVVAGVIVLIGLFGGYLWMGKQ